MPFTINGTTGINLGTQPLTGSLPDANAPSGSVIQVVSTTKTDTFSSNVNGFVDVTGLSATITPTSASSRIMVFVTTVIGSTTLGWWVGARVLRDSTPILIGATAGSRASVFGSHVNSNNTNDARNISTQGIDSPNTTSAVTYKVQAYAEGTGTNVTVNRGGADQDNSYNGRYASTITVMEIAA